MSRMRCMCTLVFRQKMLRHFNFTCDFLFPQVVLEKIDITAPGNEKIWKEYRYDIPVFHFNGNYLMKHRAGVDLFTKVLNDYFKMHS